MEYKYKLNLTQILDEEDTAYLKPIGWYHTDDLPRVNDQVALIVENENGNPVRRLYFQVVNFLHIALTGDKSDIIQNKSVVGELQCRLLLDEPVITEVQPTSEPEVKPEVEPVSEQV